MAISRTRAKQLTPGEEVLWMGGKDAGAITILTVHVEGEKIEIVTTDGRVIDCTRKDLYDIDPLRGMPDA